MNELALFAGAGGGILGGKLLGWRTVCAVEINPYAASVLIQRQNYGILSPFPIYDDIQTFTGKPWRGIVDVVSGGFPCQGFSTATRGNRKAENLWPEMCRIISEIDPRYVFAENVSEVAIQMAAEDCEAIGYKTKILTLSASDLGADHSRERYWLFAHTDHKSELCSAINAKMARLQKLCPRVWETDPGESRMDDGMAGRMDRYKAIGNGQVPAVVRLAWEILS